MTKLLEKIPLQEDEEQQGTRARRLLDVRIAIATRWSEVDPANFKGSREELAAARQVLHGQLQELMKLHGPEFPFAPLPPVLVKPSPPAGKSDSSKPASTDSKANCPHHAHRFFEGRKGVWTVLQAGLSAEGLQTASYLESFSLCFRSAKAKVWTDTATSSQSPNGGS